jgi:hypothetical protein
MKEQNMNIRRNYKPLRESKKPALDEANNRQPGISRERIRERAAELLAQYEERVFDALREEYNLSDDEAEDYLAEAEEELLQ